MISFHDAHLSVQMKIHGSEWPPTLSAICTREKKKKRKKKSLFTQLQFTSYLTDKVMTSEDRQLKTTVVFLLLRVIHITLWSVWWSSDCTRTVEQISNLFFPSATKYFLFTKAAGFPSLLRRHAGLLKNKQKFKFYMAQSYLQVYENYLDLTQLLYVDISVFQVLFFLLGHC